MSYTTRKGMNMKQSVYESIRRSIMTSEFKQGQMLSEKELSDQLNVSRTPVREAFIQLASEGLVEIYPQRGTAVTYIDLDDVIQSHFIREKLETACLLELADNISDKDLDVLQENIDAQHESCREEDYIQFYELDETFHKTMIEMSGHYKAWKVIQDNNAQVDRVRLLSLPVESRIQQLIVDHQRIVDALRERNSCMVEKCIKEHLQKIIFDVRGILDVQEKQR